MPWVRRGEVLVGIMWWAAALGVALHPGRVWMLSISDVFRGAGILLLAQGLVRDLLLLAVQCPRPPQAAPRRMLCLCVESSVGSALIAICIVLAGLGMHEQVGLSKAVVLGGGAALWSFGYLTRDLVLQVQRSPDHRSILVR